MAYWLDCIILIKDDELPDYIMVMLANKRSKEQMTEDLVLFLGTNTSLFTEWWVNSLGNCFTYKNGHDVIGETKLFLTKERNISFSSSIVHVQSVLSEKYVCLLEYALFDI